MGYRYCPGCNTHWVPGCGEEESHAGCPHDCSLCGLPITGRDDGCRSHLIDELRAHDRARRGEGVTQRTLWADDEGEPGGGSGRRVLMPRCPRCLREIYAPAVIAFSARQQPCNGCGELAPVLRTEDEYRAMLRETMQVIWERRGKYLGRSVREAQEKLREKPNGAE